MTPLVEAILEVVDCIPPGHALSYGEVGDLVGCGPRQVGRVMRDYGGLTAWWRVVRADGSLTIADRAVEHWRAENMPLAGANQDRVDMRAARPTMP